MLCGPNRSGSATRSESHFLWAPLLHAHRPIHEQSLACLSVSLAFVSHNTREQVEKKFPCQNTQIHQYKEKLKPEARPGAGGPVRPPHRPLTYIPPTCPSVRQPSRRAEAFPGCFFCGNGKRVGGGWGTCFFGLSCGAMSCHSVSCCVLGQVGYCVSIKSLTQTPEPIRV